MLYPFFKRGCDLIVSAMAIVILSPILLATVIAIKLESRGPVIFKQERLGFKGKPFWIYKFRSMVVGAEKQGTGVYSYKGDVRITKVGRFIRATSIDELPQLFNILKGEMSLIGPRPALTYHPWTFDKYTEHQRRMFDVLPGITGWAQINGRKEVPWPERIELNIYYVEHLSLALDMRILFSTFFKVLTNANNNNTSNTNGNA
ncbi:sugar transferase [Parabacteroides sp.]|uniref:sugar transferase n=1 Tax=Parabacteroides sp. TaxID=1869337 RepID=UPI00257A3655|nr:sugar transferase [Parabacteroides sp.]